MACRRARSSIQELLDSFLPTRPFRPTTPHAVGPGPDGRSAPRGQEHAFNSPGTALVLVQDGAVVAHRIDVGFNASAGA